jgi:2-oxoisovalerate dehydrogenase E2 component (dihydrolipoyl transacylase)
MKIFKLPDLGEGLQEAEIVKWHVNVGDEIKADAPMVSVETAKAVVDIPAPYSGKIAKLYGKAGDIAHIGAPLVGFEGESDARDTGTVVGKVEVGQKVMADAPAAPAPFAPLCLCAFATLRQRSTRRADAGSNRALHATPSASPACGRG